MMTIKLSQLKEIRDRLIKLNNSNRFGIKAGYPNEEIKLSNVKDAIIRTNNIKDKAVLFNVEVRNNGEVMNSFPTGSIDQESKLSLISILNDKLIYLQKHCPCHTNACPCNTNNTCDCQSVCGCNTKGNGHCHWNTGSRCGCNAQRWSCTSNGCTGDGCPCNCKGNY